MLLNAQKQVILNCRVIKHHSSRAHKIKTLNSKLPYMIPPLKWVKLILYFRPNWWNLPTYRSYSCWPSWSNVKNGKQIHFLNHLWLNLDFSVDQFAVWCATYHTVTVHDEKNCPLDVHSWILDFYRFGFGTYHVNNILF